MNQIKKILENEKSLLWLIFLVAFAIRLVYAMVYYDIYGTSLFVDDWDYISYAKEIINQGILVPNIDQIYSNGHEVGVGWPLIISPFIAVFGDNYIPIFLINALFSALHVVVLFKIAKFIFSYKVALVTVVLSTFYIRFIKFVPFVLKENIIHLCFAAVVYIFLKSLKSNQTRQVIYLALSFLVFIHIDERYAVLGPLFVVIYFLSTKGMYKIALKKSIILSGIVVVGILPWTIRNYMVYKRPIILAFQTSEFTDFLFDNSSEFYNGHSSIQKTPYVRKYLPDYEKIVSEIYKGNSVSHYKPEYKYVDLLVECINIGHNPTTFSPVKGKIMEAGEFFRVSRFRAGFTANGYRFYYKWKLLNNIVYSISFGIPFFIMLMYLFKTRLKYYERVILSIMIVYSLLHVFVIHGLVRYRVPIDGFIFIFASQGLLSFGLVKKYINRIVKNLPIR